MKQEKKQAIALMRYAAIAPLINDTQDEYGSSSSGPYIKTPDGKKHRVYVITLIDDASRFVLGADVFFHDTFVNLMSVMKSAVLPGSVL